MSTRIVIAYWLIPAEPARSFFQGVINDLARRYDASLFEPHVTVHVGSNRADSAGGAISQAARVCKPIKLKALEIGHSSEFIKTLFVQFALNAELRRDPYADCFDNSQRVANLQIRLRCRFRKLLSMHLGPSAAFHLREHVPKWKRGAR